MKKTDFIDVNRKGWNELIKANKPFSNTILPEYGVSLRKTEEDFLLMGDIAGKKVLDLGCGAGESLEYLYNKGASEVWGIDISSEQINKAKSRFPQFENNFIVSPMEEELNIPNGYFDYAISIFSIGYTYSLIDTFKNVYKHLNDKGAFIVSWTHPFYYCLDVLDGKVFIRKSYFDEESEMIKKGPDKVSLMQNNLMISTMINVAREAGFYVDTMLEEESVMQGDIVNGGYVSSFWKKEKTVNCPSTVIFKFKKIN